MTQILLKGGTGHGINGTHQIQLETNDEINLSQKFITIKAENTYFRDCPKSVWHGVRKYTINTDSIICMWE